MKTEPQLLVHCKVCDKGLIHKTRVRRFSPWVTFIGYLILIPSEFSLVAELMIFVGMIAGLFRNGTEHPESFALVAAASGIWAWPMIIMTMFTVAAAMILVDGRKVLQCDNCGAVTPRQ